MDRPKPITRNKRLQPLSRDHHHGLLLCWKIKQGFNKDVAVERIKRYTDWFYNNHIKSHFQIEETYLFPVLGEAHALVKKAITEHNRLEMLFTDSIDTSNSLKLLAEELKQHIRFEERLLFKEIEKVASEEQMNTILYKHTSEKFEENTQDEFWK